MINMEVYEMAFAAVPHQKPVSRSLSAQYDGKVLKVEDCDGNKKCKKQTLSTPAEMRNYFLSRQAHALPLHSRLQADFPLKMAPAKVKGSKTRKGKLKLKSSRRTRRRKSPKTKGAK
jgi:hypothetical protein